MCESISKIHSPSVNATYKGSQSKIHLQYVESALSQMYGFYLEGKFTDFELISCDRMK